jgi:hypothetical protein
VQPRRDSPVAVDLKVLELVGRDSVIVLRRILRHCFFSLTICFSRETQDRVKEFA